MSLVSRNCFAAVPGRAKCFFLLGPVGRRDLSAGPEQKKKQHPGCVFFAPAPPIGRGRRSAVGRRRGARATKKNTTPGVLCFCCGPVPAADVASASPAYRRGRSKKKEHPGVVFFLLRPRPDAHSLTAGLGGDVSRRGRRGGVFFFVLPRPDRGGVIFLRRPRPDAHSLRAFRQGPGGVFHFCCGPTEPGEPITKNAWCTTLGLNRPGGATAKKKHHFLKTLKIS